MIIIKGIVYTHGHCNVCSFAGLLLNKAVLPYRSFEAIADDPEGPGSLETLAVCATCFQTPAGCASPNSMHKRLPEAEYKEVQ